MKLTIATRCVPNERYTGLKTVRCPVCRKRLRFKRIWVNPDDEETLLKYDYECDKCKVEFCLNEYS